MATSEKPPILVTGGAGYIGSHTVKQLHERGERIVVLDNLCFGHREALPWPEVELVVGDIGNAALLEELFSAHRFEAVIHFAAFAYVGESVTNPLKYYQNNLAQPLQLLQTMERHQTRRLIFSSTCATYGLPPVMPIRENTPQAPINPYGASKWMLERVLADCGPAWGLHSVCLRYFNASGCDSSRVLGEDHDPETHLLPRVLMAVLGEIPELTVFGDDYPTPDGTCIRDYIHVEDLARGHVLALDYLRNGGGSFACNLGTGRGTSVKEILAAAEVVTGKTVPVVYGPRREGDPPELIADPSLAREKLGWEAAHKDVQYHLETAWHWFNGRRHYQS
jgi:UDP-glucose 4-epimerase